MENRIKKHRISIFLAIAFAVSVVFLVIFTKPAAAIRRQEYKVISLTGTTELRTQGDENGRISSVEKFLNQQAAQGWELFQVDGRVFYFRRIVETK